MILRIPRYYFLVSPTLSTLYALLGGIGADLSSGVVDGVAPALVLAGGVGASGGG